MRNITKFVIAIILVIVISMICVPGIAASILTKISVELNTLTIKINDKTLPKDNIIYNGNVYVRVDKLSDLLGKKLEWNKKSKIVTISDKFTLKTVYSGSLTDILKQKYRNTKHRVLICGMDQPEYALSPIQWLNTHGFGVEMTTLTAFTKNYINWINDFDIFIFANDRGVLPHFSDVTAIQARSALADWLSKGKQLIYYVHSSSNTITKLNAVGSVVETVSLDTVIPITITADTFTAAGTLAHAKNYPDVLGELITKDYTLGSLYRIGVTDQTVLIQATEEGKTPSNVVVYKPGCYAVVARAGTGNNATSPDMRYIDIGMLANFLIGDISGVELAQDCKYNRTIASFAIDADITTETSAIQAYLDVFRNTQLEIGLVVSKLNADLIRWYRAQFSDAEYVSHSDSHLVNTVTVRDELHIIPTSQYIVLDKAYWIANTSITYVKTQDNATTYTFKGAYATNPAATEYLYDKYSRIMVFNASEIGKTVKITYTTFDESLEWIGSLLKLKQTGLPSNDAIYLTASEMSVSPVTLNKAIRNDIVLCDHIHPNKRCYALLQGGLNLKFVPLVYPTVTNPATFVGFDKECYLTTRAVAISKVFPELIARAESKNQPILWYSHDFITSETASNSLNVGNSWNADWKRASYAETLDYAKVFFTSIVTQLNAKNVLWMRRSDYSRWYDLLNSNVTYSTTVSGGVTEIIIQNTGDKSIKGLTFRKALASSPKSVQVAQTGNLRFEFTNGELRFCIDLLAGETVKIQMS